MTRAYSASNGAGGMMTMNKRSWKFLCFVLTVALTAVSVCFAMGGIHIEVMERPDQIEYIEIGDANGRFFRAPAGDEFVFQGDMDDLFGPIISETVEEAEGKSIGITATGGGETLLELDFGAPESSVGVISAVGGMSSMALKSMIKGGPITLYVMAGLFIAAGVVAFIWLQARKLGVALVAAGASLFVVAHYPWVILLTLLIVLVIGVVMFVDYYKARGSSASLAAVVGAIRDVDEDAKKAVRKKIAEKSEAMGVGSVLRKRVSEIKAKGTA